MPCVLINQSILTPVITAGDLTITRGSDNEGDKGQWNYYFNYSSSNYFIPATDLTAIPNGAVINKIAYQLDITQANGTSFPIINVDAWVYSHPTATEFPTGLLVNGTSSSDTVYNAGITDYTQVWNNTSLSFTQQTGDPNIRYVDFTFANSFTYNGGALSINVNNKDGSYIGNTGSSPGWIGDTAFQPGKYCAMRQNDTLGSYSPTDIASGSQSFLPNIKIYWI
jgi:hypothetical protein